MGLIYYTRVLLEGFMAFAAMHYAFQWWWSKRERILLAFAVFCAANAVLNHVTAIVSSATTVETAQTALNLRTTVGLLVYPLLAWIVARVAEIRAPRFIATITVLLVAASVINMSGIPLNGVVSGLRTEVMPWGETLTVVERGPAGPTAPVIFLILLTVPIFNIGAGWIARRRDWLTGSLLLVTGIAALSGLVLTVLVDVLRLPMPYVSILNFAVWVPSLSLLLSREYALRGDRLVTSEARNRTLVESAPEAIVVLDMATTRFVDCNSKAVELFGWSREELMERGPLDISPLHQHDGSVTRDVVGGFLEQVMAGGVPVFEWLHCDRHGQEILCEVQLARLPDPRRALVRGSMTDLRERKRAELALRDVRMRHSAILELSVDGLIVIDQAGRIVEFNRAAERIFGHARSAVIGADMADLLIPPALRQAHRDGLAAFLGSDSGVGGANRREMPGVRADGSEIRVELTTQVIAGTTPPLFSGVVRDITERLRLEEQLRQSQKMEAVGQLAGGIAHDFNNLLTIIQGHTSLLQSTMTADDQHRADVDVIGNAAERAAALTQRLMTFSRRAVVAPKVVELNDVVRESEQILRRLIGEDMRLEVTLDPDAGRVRVDAAHMGQVIMNLALNARDATPAGGLLTLTTSSVQVDADAPGAQTHPAGRYARLTVSDTGTGMTADVRAHVFEPFFTTKEVGKGTGLGMAVVHGIVEQGGGYIDIDTELGRGTAVTVDLPAVDDAVAAEPDPAPIGAFGTETILLVEDEDGVRSLMARTLREQGFEVLTAANGTDALQLAARHERPPDLLVTDVVMPGMTGRELADALRQRHPTLKVLFVSGYTDDALLKRGVLEAREALLAKPFLPRELAARVRQIIDGKLPLDRPA
jgi:two-component system, cell cycle sensor histidine kinase and response regulator CckA